MHRLVYYSANRILGSIEELTAQVEQILATSRRNNEKVGVTGALMFSEGFFGQVLEGPQAAVEATFERIQRDARHSDVSLLQFEQIEKQQFENWSMACVGQTALIDFEGIGLSSGFDPAKLKGEKLLNRLVELVIGELV
ncbi:MAG: BLUF domain-containing protein [Rhizobium sp.]